MKKLFLLVILIYLSSCSKSEELVNDNKRHHDLVSNMKTMIQNSTSSNKLFYEASDDNLKIKFYSENINNEYNSIIEFYNINDDKILDMSYSFDISEAHWKIKQKESVLALATSLQNSNVDITMYDEILKFLYIAIPIIYDESVVANNKDVTLFSSIYYYQAALNSLLRSKISHSPIEGTINPTFLVDKDFFIFQEDQYFDLSLVNTQDMLPHIHSIADQNLYNFVVNNNSKLVSALELNQFYGSKENFNAFLNNLVNGTMDKGCSSSCWIGCGSDIGCCGNYSGCCVYSSMACLVHDTQCSTCTPPKGYPSGYCLPGCKPNNGGTKPVKVLLSYGF